MAESTITVVTILPWPLFQAFIDSKAAIGAKLYSYAPSTSTPKATYGDWAFLAPNTNPVILDDQGKHLVYLNGNYDLRLYSADDVLIWTVDNWTYDTGSVPMAGTIITGASEATVNASPGAGVVSVPTLAPAGYRVLGVTSTITTGFGASNGMAAMAIGDNVLLDRWGIQGTLTPGAQTSQMFFRAGDCPITTVAYTVLLSAINGLFDATGTIHLTCYYQALAVDTP